MSDGFKTKTKINKKISEKKGEDEYSKEEMGSWRLEVARMALYVTFPVALFHYFNQPEYFEEWVIKKKREMYPPDDKSSRVMLEEGLKKIKAEREKRMIEEMEKSITSK